MIFFSKITQIVLAIVQKLFRTNQRFRGAVLSCDLSRLIHTEGLLYTVADFDVCDSLSRVFNVYFNIRKTNRE